MLQEREERRAAMQKPPAKHAHGLLCLAVPKRKADAKAADDKLQEEVDGDNSDVASCVDYEDVDWLEVSCLSGCLHRPAALPRAIQLQHGTKL